MPNYTDKDNEAFNQIGQFGPAGRESLDPSTRGVSSMQRPSLSYSREDLEHFNKLMNFGRSQSTQIAMSTTKGAGESRYTMSDLSQFERLMPSTSGGQFNLTGGIRQDARVTVDAGQYTAMDQQAFEALMRLESGLEIPGPEPVSPRTPGAASRETAATSVPLRASIKIVDTDAERTRERENAIGGVRKIKIVFSDASGPNRRDRDV